MQSASTSETAFWKKVFGKPERTKQDLDQAMALISSHNAVQLTLDQADVHIQNAKAALQCFEPGKTRTLLCDVCDFVLERSF